MDLIRISTALGCLAAICNQRNPNISRELLREMIDSPSATLRELMIWYHSNLYNENSKDFLERCRNNVVREIGAELGVEIPSEIFPNLHERLDQNAFGDGQNSERRILRKKPLYNE